MCVPVEIYRWYLPAGPTGEYGSGYRGSRRRACFNVVSTCTQTTFGRTAARTTSRGARTADRWTKRKPVSRARTRTSRTRKVLGDRVPNGPINVLNRLPRRRSVVPGDDFVADARVRRRRREPAHGQAGDVVVLSAVHVGPPAEGRLRLYVWRGRAVRRRHRLHSICFQFIETTWRGWACSPTSTNVVTTAARKRTWPEFYSLHVRWSVRGHTVITFTVVQRRHSGNVNPRAFANRVQSHKPNPTYLMEWSLNPIIFSWHSWI